MISRGQALRRAFAWPVVRRSLLVSAIVGTALNAINQGSEIFTGQEPIVWRLILTYFVPFAVATYGAYGAIRSQDC